MSKEVQKEKDLQRFLEEDEDDFQEFQQEISADTELIALQSKMWNESWDDEDPNDDFTIKLKKELGL